MWGGPRQEVAGSLLLLRVASGWTTAQSSVGSVHTWKRTLSTAVSLSPTPSKLRPDAHPQQCELVGGCGVKPLSVWQLATQQ